MCRCYFTGVVSKLFFFYFYFCSFPPSQFEKEKQHDIRSFFSPGGKEKKRKRREDEESSPFISSGSGSGTTAESGERPGAQTPLSPDHDFSPQLKRLRTPQLGRGVRRRRSAAAAAGSASPVPSMAPRRLTEPRPPAEKWGCGSCTYSNSSLLPYCEMCEFPRSPAAVHSGRTAA